MRYVDKHMVEHSSYGIYGVHGQKQMENEKKVVSTLAFAVNIVAPCWDQI